MTTLTILLALIFSELMQSNIDCVMDDMNEFPDSWVELYNSGSNGINIQQYSIGTGTNPAEAYQLPNLTLDSHSYILIYCDKENTGLHTDFRIDCNGDKLYLFQSGVTIDRIENIPAQPSPNTSYGREGSIWGWMTTATPAAANSPIATGILAPPTFCTIGQVFTTTPNLALTLTLPNGAPETAYICYTTDGSEPQATGTRYTGPIRINKSTVVRARTFAPGYLSLLSHTESYLHLNHASKLPVVSLVTDQRYLNDKNIGIYVTGNNANNPNYRKNWRRPFHFEYFEHPDTTATLMQLCEGRIQGAASRDFPLKSLALYANKRFGEKHFKHEFFPEQKPKLKKFKSIVLRNTGNDFQYTYIRDALIQRVAGENCDLDWQASQPAIIFINGIYKGIEYIRERANDSNIYTNYDGLEDVDVIENNWDVKSGDGINWWAFQAFYNEHGHTWDEYEQWMDCQEYINLMVMNTYFNNLDFPANNICCWRPRSTDSGLPTRWRWIVKDCDYSIGIYDTESSFDYLAWLNDNGYDSRYTWANTSDGTRLFRRLMEDTTFYHRFLECAIVYTGDFLTNSFIRSRYWDSMWNAIRDEYNYHRDVYYHDNPWWPNLPEQLTHARNWLIGRNGHFANMLSRHFDIGSPVMTGFYTELDTTGMKVAINDIPLTRAYWSGYGFTNHPLTMTVSSTQYDDQQYVWQVTHRAKSDTTETVYGPTCDITIRPEDSRVMVELTIETPAPEGIKRHDTPLTATKVLQQGKIVILRNNKKYNLIGQNN